MKHPLEVATVRANPGIAARQVIEVQCTTLPSAVLGGSLQHGCTHRSGWPAHRRSASALCMVLAMGPGFAAELRDAPDEQRDRRERINEWRREQERRAPLLIGSGSAGWQPPVVGESPCFVIRSVRIVPERRAPEAVAATGTPEAASDAAAGGLPWSGLSSDLRDFEGACLGAASIERLRDNLQSRLEARGYITSALHVPPQDLRTGELLMTLDLGVVEAVAWEGPATASRPGANALAVGPGRALNLRDIEQTLENLGRLSSQSARFVIEPGTTPGGSVVRILPIQPDAAAWRASLGADRTDRGDYGDVQYTGQLGLDHVLHLSDQLGLWLSHSQGRAAEGGDTPIQSSWYAYWAVPVGHHAFTLSFSRADYRRFIAAGVGRFRDAGRDATSRVRWEWTFWRGATGRLQLWAAVSQRRARTYLDDIELISRRRLGISVEQGLSLWMRQAPCDLRMELEGMQVRRLKRDEEFQAPLEGLPATSRAEAQWTCALPSDFELSGQGWVERVHRPVDGSDLVVLGSRQTVRAHAPADALAGLGQAVLRHELRLPPWRPGASAVLRPHVALDWGRIHAPLDNGVAGRELTALAIGMRWYAGRATGQLAFQRPIGAPAAANASVSQARRDVRWQASFQLGL